MTQAQIKIRDALRKSEGSQAKLEEAHFGENREP